jgi:CBS domain-containing protein
MIKNCMKRKVYSIPSTATIRQAAALVVQYHIGLLPVVDEQGKPIGVIRLGDLLSLELPAFFSLLPDIDFVHDFGAVETTRPSAAELDRPVKQLTQPWIFVEESCGLLRAYSLMLKHNLYDLPVVDESGTLVGIASRVDIGAAVLSAWEAVPSSSSP